MARLMAGAALIILTCGPAFVELPIARGQSQEKALGKLDGVKPEFEVATLKIVPPDGAVLPTGTHGGPGTADPGRITYGSSTLMNLVCEAYDVRQNQVFGPAWIRKSMFDIAAKVPLGATKQDVRMMLQSLLSDRLHLVVHHESRDFPLYELTLGKRAPRLKASAATTDLPDSPLRTFVDKDGKQQLAPGARGLILTSLGARAFRLTARGKSLKEFADRANLGLLTDGVMVDKTGMTGTFDFTLEFRSGPDTLSSATDVEPSYPNFLMAVQEQLGLKIEKKTGPMDVIVVDSAAMTPTPN